jgi:hypothetical protein
MLKGLVTHCWREIKPPDWEGEKKSQFDFETIFKKMKSNYSTQTVTSRVVPSMKVFLYVVVTNLVHTLQPKYTKQWWLGSDAAVRIRGAFKSESEVAVRY